MTALGTEVLSWKDVKAMYANDGTMLDVANVLEESAGWLTDAVWVPSNKELGHVTSQITALPTVGRYRFNRGTASSKGSQMSVEDRITMISGQSVVDKKLLQVYGGPVAARRRENRLFAEAMTQQCSQDVLYGSIASDPEGINGFMTRLNTLGNQVISGGGTTADMQSSVLLIGWGRDKTYMTHPKNVPAGLVREDTGEDWVQEGGTTIGGRKMRAYIDHWCWDYGLVCADPRYQVRGCNIESADVLGVSGAQELTDYSTNIVTLMARMTERIYNIEACMPAFYMSRKLREGLKVQYLARTLSNVFTFEQIDGRRVFAYEGIPIRALDRLTNTEAIVT